MYITKIRCSGKHKKYWIMTIPKEVGDKWGNRKVILIDKGDTLVIKTSDALFG